MSDPFLTGAGSHQHREQQRLLRENKELREEITKLRVQTASAITANSVPSSTQPTAPPRRKKTTEDGGTDGGPKSVNENSRRASERIDNGALAKLKAELQQSQAVCAAAEKKAAKIQSEYTCLKDQFESFVSHTCEREEAYKMVYQQIYEELEERKGHCESLQRQLHDLRERPCPADRPTTSTLSPVDAGVVDVIGELRDLLGVLEGHLGVQSGVATSETSQRRSKTVRPRQAHRVPAPASQEPVTADAGAIRYIPPPPVTIAGNPPAAQLVIVKGAGALRDHVSDASSFKTDRPAAAPRRRGRPPGPVSQLKRVKGEMMSPTGSLPSFFDGFAATETGSHASAGGASTRIPREGLSAPAIAASSKSEVHFGGDAIDDYITLLDCTTPNNVDRLNKELLKHFQSDVSVLATHIVEHLLLKRVQETKLDRLWKLTVHALRVHKDVFIALYEATMACIIRIIGPESSTVAAQRDQLQTLSLLLRFACVQHGKETGSPRRDLLARACYEAAIAALQVWRSGRPGDPADPAGEVDRRAALSLWMCVAMYLFGYLEEIQMLLRYFNMEEVSAALGVPRTLSFYTLQGVVSMALLADEAALTHSNLQEWHKLCCTIGWSQSQLPVERIGEAATHMVSTASNAEDYMEAVLSIRLIVLYKGFGYLHTLTERIQRARTGRSDVDAIFASLFSFAVIDLQLQDPRDEQWQRAASFFTDYLRPTGPEMSNSLREMISSVTSTHVLVMGGLLQLCRGLVNSDLVAEQDLRHLRTALRWLKAQKVALHQLDAAKGGTSGTLQLSHPLRDTVGGRTLLSLLDI